MSDIFISYSREDKERAAELAALFARQEWDVWWDRDLIPGDKYEEVIARVLTEAKAVVVLWSPTSITSGWVKDEARKGSGRGVLVPLLIAPVDIPLGFGDFHTADFTRWDGSPSSAEAEGLLRRVAALIDKPAVAVRPTAGQRLSYFYRRRRAAVLATALLALVALLGLFGAKFFSSQQPPSDDQLTAARLTAEGNKLAGESNYDGAILIYNEVVNRFGAYPDVYYYRGQSFISAGEEPEALADFQRALELNVREPLRRKAADYIQKLRQPPTASPTPYISNTNTSNTNTSNTNASNTNTQNANVKNVNSGNSNIRNNNASLPPPPSNMNASNDGDAAALRAQVGQMFSGDRDVRIESTTKLVIERKKDPRVVGLAVAAAAAQPGNLSGVINTLVLLESVDATILKAHKDEIERLLALIKNNGPVTAGHVAKVRALLDR